MSRDTEKRHLENSLNSSSERPPEPVEIVLRQAEGEDRPTEYMVVRKRRSRRRPALEAESPQQRFRLILLIVVVVLIIVSLTGGDQIRAIMQQGFNNAKSAIPSPLATKLMRPEVLLLFLAAIVLIYLMIPGLDTKILGLFGSKNNRRRH